MEAKEPGTLKSTNFNVVGQLDPAVEQLFTMTSNGVYMERRKYPRGTPCSEQKVCFVATDCQFLAALMAELSELPDCYYVKYSVTPCDGMYLGRCFMLTDEAAGRLWAKYKPHPRLMCSLQDDNFTRQFRPSTDASSKST